MTAPAHALTWQFQESQLAAPASTALASCRNLMLAIHQSMIGAGVWTDQTGAVVASSGNWTVTSSCDGSGGAGSFGNNDNVDRWVAVGSLVWAAAASNHSWCVFQQTGIAPLHQVCVDLSSAGPQIATIVVSPTLGFGLANGGVDGTAVTRPTALDEKVLIANTTWGGPTAANFGSILHVLKSADGKCTRIFIMRDTVVYGYWQFEQPVAYDAAWTNPSSSAAVGLGTTGAPGTAANPQSFFIQNANQWSKTAAGLSFASFCTAPGDTTNQDPNYLNFENELDGSYCYMRPLLFSTTVTARGPNGYLRDMYWASSMMANGFQGPKATGPADVNAKKWRVIGPFFQPWNGKKMRVRV